MSYSPARPRTVIEYVRPNGANPFRRWLDRLDSQAALKITVAVERLARGNTSNFKWLSGVGELVIDWGPGFRVYLTFDGDSLLVLFGGGTKRRQQADIDRARLLHAEYRSQQET